MTLDGKMVFDQGGTVDVNAQNVIQALSLPVFKDISSVYFVRCELFDADGTRIVDNVYWQSTTPDEFGPRANDNAFNVQEEQWADFTPLQSMTKVHLDVKGTIRKIGTESEALISLHNPSTHLAFFVRAEVTGGKDGNEILPVTYDNNYVTVFPGETVSIHGKFADLEFGPAMASGRGRQYAQGTDSHPLGCGRYLSSIACFSAPAAKAIVWVSLLTEPRLFPSTNICMLCRRGRIQSATLKSHVDGFATNARQ